MERWQLCVHGQPAGALQSTSLYDYVSILKVDGGRRRKAPAIAKFRIRRFHGMLPSASDSETMKCCTPLDQLIHLVLTPRYWQTLRILRLFKFLKSFHLLAALKNLKITA